MSTLRYFEVTGDHAEYRPIGQVSLSQMVQMVASALAFAREQDIRKLLVVTSGLTGFRPPFLADRFDFIQEWARASGHVVRAALVARPEMIDRQKFGVTVAANNGFTADIFASEEGSTRLAPGRQVKSPRYHGGLPQRPTLPRQLSDERADGPAVVRRDRGQVAGGLRGPDAGPLEPATRARADRRQFHARVHTRRRSLGHRPRPHITGTVGCGDGGSSVAVPFATFRSDGAA